MTRLLNKESEDRLDPLQLAALAVLMFIGTMFVCSATMANASSATLPWYDQIWVRQIIWYVLGLGAAAGICLTDYHTLARWSFVAYWATILCLVAVLIPHIGSTHGWGARRWIDLRAVPIPAVSEFAKLAFILAAANFLSRPPDELRQRGIFWKAIGLMMLPFGLILKEPDLGSALVLLPTGLVMMYVAGTPRNICCSWRRWSEFWSRCCWLTFCSRHASLQIPMQDYQRQRLLVYFGANFANANAIAGGKGVGAQLAISKIVSSPAGADFGRLGRAAGQGLAQGRPDRAGLFAAGRGAQ